MFILLLTLIFTRPFISSLAFPYANFIHSLILCSSLLIWLILNLKSCAKLAGLKYPLLFFIFSLGLSLFFAHDKALALAKAYEYAAALLILFFSASLTEEQRPKAIAVLVLAGLAISMLSLYQYAFGFRHLLEYISKEKIPHPFALDIIRRQRVFFPFVTPNTLAGYLIMIIPLAAMKKNYSWVLIPLSLALLFTRSLGALTSLFLALCICLYLRKKFGRKELLILSAVLACTVVFFITRSFLEEKILRPYFSGVMRLSYWKEAWGIIKAHPVAGVGLGNFNLSFSRYAHNSYLQLWAEGGIFSLLSFLWLTFSILKNAYSRPLLVTAASVFLIHNSVDFTFFLPEVSFIWWAILGLGYSAQHSDVQAPLPQGQRS